MLCVCVGCMFALTLMCYMLPEGNEREFMVEFEPENQKLGCILTSKLCSTFKRSFSK